MGAIEMSLKNDLIMGGTIGLLAWLFSFLFVMFRVYYSNWFSTGLNPNGSSFLYHLKEWNMLILYGFVLFLCGVLLGLACYGVKKNFIRKR